MKKIILFALLAAVTVIPMTANTGVTMTTTCSISWTGIECTRTVVIS